MKAHSALILSVCCACSLVGCSGPATTGQQASAKPTNTVDSTLRSEERAFLIAMGQHEKTMLGLSQDAKRQANSDQLKQFAERQSSSANKELSQLQALGALSAAETADSTARQPGQPVVSVTENPGGVKGQGHSSYDQRWLKAFLKNNQVGLEMARKYKPQLKNKSLLGWNDSLCREAEAAQREAQELSKAPVAPEDTRAFRSRSYSNP